eukprot:1944540-Pleurochrysis_carterae.AAC.2
MGQDMLGRHLCLRTRHQARCGHGRATDYGKDAGQAVARRARLPLVVERRHRPARRERRTAARQGAGAHGARAAHRHRHVHVAPVDVDLHRRDIDEC